MTIKTILMSILFVVGFIQITCLFMKCCFIPNRRTFHFDRANNRVAAGNAPVRIGYPYSKNHPPTDGCKLSPIFTQRWG